MHNTSHIRRLRMKCSEIKLYYNLSFEFGYRVLSGRENKIHFCESEDTR
jgi:hypothetical protein